MLRPTIRDLPSLRVASLRADSIRPTRRPHTRLERFGGIPPLPGVTHISFCRLKGEDTMTQKVVFSRTNESRLATSG